MTCTTVDWSGKRYMRPSSRKKESGCRVKGGAISRRKSWGRPVGKKYESIKSGDVGQPGKRSIGREKWWGSSSRKKYTVSNQSKSGVDTTVFSYFQSPAFASKPKRQVRILPGRRLLDFLSRNTWGGCPNKLNRSTRNATNSYV